MHKKYVSEIIMQLNCSIDSMVGLRFHAMAKVSPDCILVHGGRHFKSKDNVTGAVYVFTRVSPDDKKLKWYEVPQEESVRRFGHQLVFDEEGKKVFVVGGFESDSDKSVCTIRELKFC